MQDNSSSYPDTMEKRLYQLIISRLDGNRIGDDSYRGKMVALVEKGIGGFILFGGRKDEVRAFLAFLRSVAAIPLFIASDVERGVGQQVGAATLFPCQMAVAAAINRSRESDSSLLHSAVQAIADEAKDVGINIPLIPVLDVNSNPDNPIICTRAFSDKAEVAAWFGAEYIKTIEASGLISCGKHFPGHGDTSVDSHLTLPVITKPLSALRDIDLVPFVKAIHAGVSSIMIGHLSVPVLDTRPASLSERVITGLLRKELGFEGLVMTDALNMSALKGMGNIPAQCIKAGADILLHPPDAEATVAELGSALRAKDLSEAEIEGAISRILKFKRRLAETRGGNVDYEGHAMLSRQLFERSIAVVKQRTALLPFPPLSQVNAFFAGERELCEASLLKTYFTRSLFLGDAAGAPLPPAQESGDPALTDKVTLFVIFTNVAAWRGSSGIDDEQRRQILGLIEKDRRSAVVSFGSPYVLRHFARADLLVAAYDTSEQAQRAVIQCLQGERDITGRLPVTLHVDPPD